jgi:ketosteroid isomerase-like protein
LQKEQAVSLEENKEVVRRYFDEVWTKGNLAALGDYVTDDVRDYALGPDPLPGPGSVLAHHKLVMTNLRQFHVAIEELVAEGDLVVAFWTGSAVHAASGLPVSAPAVSRLRVLGGKIAEYRVLSDRGNRPQQPAVGGTAAASGT